MTFSDRVWSAVINSWGATFTLVGFSISILSFFVVPNSLSIALSFPLVFIPLAVAQKKNVEKSYLRINVLLISNS